MADPFIGEIRLVSWNYPPRGWAFCDGATLSISTNQALFALIGTTYGGDGRTTFKLPDFRGRVPVSAAPNTPIGTAAGEETHALSVAETPPHTHTLQGTANAGGNLLAPNAWLGPIAKGYAASPAQSNLIPGSVSQAGSTTPHENRQPYLCLSFAIALNGIFPSRS